MYQLIWEWIYNILLRQTALTYTDTLAFSFGRDSWLPLTNGVFDPSIIFGLLAHLGTIAMLTLFVIVMLNVIKGVFRLFGGAFRWR